MNTYQAILGLLPLLAFALFDLFATERNAIIGSIVVAFLAFLGLWYFIGEFDSSMFAELVLLILLGLASLKLKSALMFKFQPAVIEIFTALFLFWFQIWDQPYLLAIKPRMVKIVPNYAHLPEEYLTALSWQMGALLLAHGLFMVWAAKQRTRVWLGAKISLYPTFLAFLYLTMLLSQL